MDYKMKSVDDSTTISFYDINTGQNIDLETNQYIVDLLSNQQKEIEDLKAKIRKLKEDCPESDNSSRSQYLNRDITKLIELTDLIAFLLNNVKVELENQIADTIHISMTLSGLAIDVENYKGESVTPEHIYHFLNEHVLSDENILFTVRGKTLYINKIR